MGTCCFDAKQVIPLIEHAMSCTSWSMGYHDGAVTPMPGLLLVHDSGVYLMSNGNPILPRKDGGEGSEVVYAENCHPVNDKDCWEMSRALVGGDDFVEVMPITDATDLIQSCLSHDRLLLHVDKKSILVSFENQANRGITGGLFLS